MKKLIKLIGFLALTAVISFAFVTCGESGGGRERPVLTGTVSIRGNAQVGYTLRADTSDLGGSGSIYYEWRRGNEVSIISDGWGEWGRTYTVRGADVGSTITMTVSRSGNSGSITSNPTMTVVVGLDGTPNLAFTLISDGTAYSVSRGTAYDSVIFIPSIFGGKPVIEIGNSGFSSAQWITNITIPDSVTSIGNSAFSRCTGLTSITIPDSVMSIESWAFSGCTGLTSITVDVNNPNYSSQDGILYNKAKTQIIYIPQNISGSITIPNSVTSIGNAFSGFTGLTSITIPNSVTSIGRYAFSGCTGLTSITIPDSVTFIGESAFSGCASLTSITIPSSVTSIGSFAFFGCTGLTSITIPSGVTSIGSQAFRDCTGLTSITMPNSVTSIGSNAFAGCTGLTSITIPSSVTSIGDSAFWGCTGLISVTIGTISEGNFVFNAFPGNLRDVYFASGGGAGTYITANPGNNPIWVKQ